MSLSTSETYHHTPEQVRGYIDEGERILQACGYTDAERIALLPDVIRLLSSKSMTIVERAPIMAGAMEIPSGARRRQ